ncbi:MAG: hypothetical protein ACTSUE_23325 [Promethearchaeota archaeon]
MVSDWGISGVSGLGGLTSPAGVLKRVSLPGEASASIKSFNQGINVRELRNQDHQPRNLAKRNQGIAWEAHVHFTPASRLLPSCGR